MTHISASCRQTNSDVCRFRPASLQGRLTEQCCFRQIQLQIPLIHSVQQTQKGIQI